LLFTSNKSIAKPTPLPLPVIERKKGVRKHGFNCPFNPLQLITYFVYFYDLITFSAMNMTSLSSNLPLVIICGLLYYTLSLVVFVYAIKATLSDPSDPTIMAQLLSEA